MCGIIGMFNNENALPKVLKGLSILKNRGRDGYGIYDGKNVKFSKKIADLHTRESNCAIGHCLHSVVNYVPQPFNGNGIFVGNCEIYNWQELNQEIGLNAKNDSELLFFLLERLKAEGTELEMCLKKLDGVYAFAYWRNDTLILARDLIGEKPIWYANNGGFAFASEKKALEKIGYIDVHELNPRKILRYHTKKGTVSFTDREFFSIIPQDKRPVDLIKQDLRRLLLKAADKRLPSGKFGLLFSGGLDSSVLAFLFKELKRDFTCYTAVMEGMGVAQDLEYAEKVAKIMGLELKIVKVHINELEKYLKKIVPLIEDSNVVKVGVGLPFFIACEQAKKDKIKVIFSGLGSEEIFGGYQRHKNSSDINLECLSGLLKMYERDLYRDDVVCMFNNLELRLPFLDHKLVDFSLKIPGKYKIKDENGKYILRLIAADMEVPVAWRPKKAAQYGSKFDKGIEKLSKQAGKSKSGYLADFYPAHNLKLGVLASSGKDSLYAAYVMKKQNYKISCLINIKSRNPDSYMFHTPNVDLVKMQAEAMDVPLIQQESSGEKEKELEDLKSAIIYAKSKFHIDGIVTGAIHSNYQRGRIENICDGLGLKIFAPLWHVNQEKLMQDIITSGFEFIISSIAAEGLDKSWLGCVITLKEVDKLSALNKKNRINIAFEGGEAETLVLDCPLFRFRIAIADAEIIMENECTGFFRVKQASANPKIFK